MTGTRVVTIGDVAEIFDGPHATPTRTNAGPYFLNIASLINGRLDLSQSDHVSESEYVAWTRRVTPRAGDLLFSYETRLGEAALMPAGVRACLGRRMALLRFREDYVYPQFFLYYYISPIFRQLIDARTIHGATVPRIALSTIGTWRITLPSLSEQRAIADVLGALDDKIAANHALVARTVEMATALVSGLHRSTPLRDLVSQRSIAVAPDAMDFSVVELYSLPAFDSGQHPELCLPKEIKSNKLAIRRPCVLLSKLNPRFPRVWDLPNVPPTNAFASTEFLILEPVSESSSVVWAVLSDPRFTTALQSKARGTSGSHQRVKPGDALATEVVNPVDMTVAARHLLAGVGLRIAAARTESRTLATLRDTLLPALMSGRLRVRDAEKQVEAAT